MVIVISISIMVINGVFFDCEQDIDANINCMHYSFLVMNVVPFGTWTIRVRGQLMCPTNNKKPQTT